MAVIRALTKMAINHFGYDVRRVATPATVHIAEPGTDPITFEYVREFRGYAVFEISLADVRGFQSLALPLHAGAHPFVRAAEFARHETREELAKERIENVLRTYYDEVRPTSAVEVFDLRWDDLPGLRGVAPDSDNHPSDVDFLPWSGRTPAAVEKGRELTAVFEGLQNGVITKISDGVTSFGPVQPAKLALEVSRLSRLVTSVKARGFSRLDPRSPLQVAAFRRGNEYKWVINHGQHRFATAAAFDIGSLPAMVTEVVRRDDAQFWPQVVSGIFTEAGALSIFDRIYDGTPAAVCQSWIKKFRLEEGRNVAD